MAFVDNGSIIPSTVSVSDPIVITVNRDVEPGEVAVLFITNDGSNVSVSGVTDSSSNSWTVYQFGNTAGRAAIAYALIETQLDNASDTISVNMSSGHRTIVRGAGYSGLTAVRDSEASKAAEEAAYSLSWTATDDGMAFVVFGFPVDYAFGDDDITGWEQEFVTDDLTGLQSQQVFRRDEAAGSVSCSNTAPTVYYLAAGILLPYLAAGHGQAVVVL